MLSAVWRGELFLAIYTFGAVCIALHEVVNSLKPFVYIAVLCYCCYNLCMVRILLLSCSYGSFPIAQHNEVQDLTATLMTEVCCDVQVKPHLYASSGDGLFSCA